MDESIENRVCQIRISDNLAPFLDRELGGDERRLCVVAIKGMCLAGLSASSTSSWLWMLMMGGARLIQHPESSSGTEPAQLPVRS